MANEFEVCRHCKPPRRHPGCQDHCPDYIIPNMFRQADLMVYNQRKAAEDSVYFEKCRQCDKAVRKRDGKC